MAFLPLFQNRMETNGTKDRIRMIMEEQHMTQQVFADFLQQSPATLSSIFNGRTRPSLQVIDAIKSKIPNISIEWLLYGTGDKYITHSSEVDDTPVNSPTSGQQQVLNFDAPVSDLSGIPLRAASAVVYPQSVNNTHTESFREDLKLVDKQKRKVTEIRVYYDDQTYETFVPAKTR